MKTQTSITNPEGTYVSAWSRIRQAQRGFTLIELLVVLAIAGLLVGLVPFSFNKMHEGSQYRDSVRNIVSELRQARQMALSTGRNVVFAINLHDRQFGVLGGKLASIPESVEVKATTAAFTQNPNGSAFIEFFPGGGSTGGTIELIRSSGSGVQVRVDWLLGQITQEPNQQ